jgi:hypothetical protein
MTCHVKVVWQKENFIGRNHTRAIVEQATQRVRPLRKNFLMHHERKRGTKDLGSKRLLYVRRKRATKINIRGWSSGQPSPLRKKRTTMDGTWKWRPGERTLLGSGRTLYKILYKISCSKNTKQMPKASSRTWRIMEWTLLRGRPPPKWKKRLQAEQEPVM